LRLIHKDNPKAEEVRQWMDLSGLELKRFFNTNGKLFKEMNLKERWDTLSQDELLSILESDGMIHKRPVLVGEDFVLTGFKIKEWEEQLK
jgi:arsenate reductase